MKRAICILICAFLLLALFACGKLPDTQGSESSPSTQPAEPSLSVTTPKDHIKTTELEDIAKLGYVFNIFTEDREKFSFEEDELWRRGENGLTRDAIFGDEELQRAAAAACEGLDLTAATHVLEYAYRLMPIIDTTDYFNVEAAKWIPQQMLPTSISYYPDGVWYIHYEERPVLPENYDEMTEEERHRGYTLDGGVYVHISTSDGHIISLENAFNGLIEGKTATTYGIESEVPPLKYRQADIFLNDVTLGQHFTGWSGKKGEMYEGAPKEVSSVFEDQALQEAAAAACADLELDTIEGMSEYAWRLGELLCDTEYQVSDVGYDVSFMTRYTDGSWEIHLRYPKEPLSASSDKNHAYVYVSEADGHIICMFDANGSLIQK